MSRETLAKKVDQLLLNIKKRITEILQKTGYVTMTWDIWPSSDQSFMGVTASVLDRSNHFLPIILAVRRFTGLLEDLQLAAESVDFHCSFLLSFDFSY